MKLIFFITLKTERLPILPYEAVWFYSMSVTWKSLRNPQSSEGQTPCRNIFLTKKKYRETLWHIKIISNENYSTNWAYRCLITQQCICQCTFSLHGMWGAVTSILFPQKIQEWSSSDVKFFLINKQSYAALKIASKLIILAITRITVFSKMFIICWQYTFFSPQMVHQSTFVTVQKQVFPSLFKSSLPFKLLCLIIWKRLLLKKVTIFGNSFSDLSRARVVFFNLCQIRGSFRCPSDLNLADEEFYQKPTVNSSIFDFYQLLCMFEPIVY